MIRQTYSEQPYVTYLYEYDGYLRELFIQDGVDAKASDGRKILASDCFPLMKLRTDCFICIVQTKTAVFPILMSVSKVRRNA